SVRPVGYVDNNGDLCPDEFGTTNGCEYTPPSLSDENYVYTRNYGRAMSDPEELARNSDVIESVVYYDGLGRPMQGNAIKASPDLKDIITHMEYDVYGRQDKQWLPYTGDGITGSYRDQDPAGDTDAFYAALYPGDIHSGPNPFS